jgi:predicted  nucleic acid-binding Zn-ribbon protein
MEGVQMNHIGDTNKMVDTPRMKAAVMAAMEHGTGNVYRVGCDIERELNAANVEIEEKRKDVVWLATEKAKSENYVTELENRLRALWDKYDGDRKHYIDRIKRLEEAGDFLSHYLREMPYASSYLAQIDERILRINNWREAREDKL